MEISILITEHLIWYKEHVCRWYPLSMTNLHPPCEPRAKEGLFLEDLLDLCICNLDDVVLLELLGDSFRFDSTSGQYLKATGCRMLAHDWIYHTCNFDSSKSRRTSCGSSLG
jgi:hypothetical protein